MYVGTESNQLVTPSQRNTVMVDLMMSFENYDFPH